MLLVHVGTYTINVDHVAAFIEEGEKTVVVFNFAGDQAPGDARVPYQLELEGDDSKHLRAWLRKNAEGGREGTAGFAIMGQEQG